eukprot:3217531-Rhodomonas_salina.1
MSSSSSPFLGSHLRNSAPGSCKKRGCVRLSRPSLLLPKAPEVASGNHDSARKRHPLTRENDFLHWHTRVDKTGKFSDRLGGYCK